MAMSLGLVALLGSFMAFDRAFFVSNQVSDRADALQRGRQAMELITGSCALRCASDSQWTRSPSAWTTA